MALRIAVGCTCDANACSCTAVCLTYDFVYMGVCTCMARGYLWLCCNMVCAPAVCAIVVAVATGAPTFACRADARAVCTTVIAIDPNTHTAIDYCHFLLAAHKLSVQTPPY